MMLPANDMDDELSLTELHEARVQIYQWFSQQFLTELAEGPWQALSQHQLSPFFDLLTDLGLEAEVTAYTQALEQLKQQYGDEARIRLASDFAHAFLLSGRDSALPYASAYEADADGQLYGVATRVMKQFLQQVGLSLPAEFTEPEDHLVVYLVVLSALAAPERGKPEKTQLAQQLDFVEQALLSWLPQFVAAVQKVSLHSTVYPRLATLLLAYVQQDQRFLKNQLLQVAASE